MKPAVACWTLSCLAATTLHAQSAVARELGVVSLAGLSASQLPPGIQVIRGSLQVVTKDGASMLRATSPSEFVLTLGAPLPADFTVEVELIPKGCCPPEDLGLEGTPTLSESAASAHLLWHPTTQIVLGGGERYEGAVPETLREALPGQLTRIVVVFQGTTVRMYTNGRRLYTLTDRRFVRGRVLRVFLGGQNSGANAVHLAALRVVEGIHAPMPTSVELASTQSAQSAATPTSQQSTPLPVPVSSQPQPQQTAQSQSAMTVDTTLPPNSTAPLPVPPQREDGTGIRVVAPPPAPSPTVTTSRTGQAGEVTRVGTAPPASLTRLAPRVIGLGGLTVTGVSSTIPPRTIALSGLTVTGVSSTLAPRSITLSALTVTGVSTTLPPRAIALSGLVITGVSSTLAPRTIALTGLTVTGITP